MQTSGRLDAIVDGVHDNAHTSFVRHPLHATAEEAAHLQEVADEGKSPATPAILVGAVLAFLTPIVAILITLDFGIAHIA